LVQNKNLRIVAVHFILLLCLSLFGLIYRQLKDTNCKCHQQFCYHVCHLAADWIKT